MLHAFIKVFFILPLVRSSSCWITCIIIACTQAGIDCGFPAVRDALSLQYLDWTVMVGGVKKARRVYQR